MSSDPRTEIPALIEKTERNLKLIEEINGEFVYPTLNEWRYATRHVASLLATPEDEEECNKAVSHLKRAYFDSCDILLDCILARIRDYGLCYHGYASIVSQIVPDFQNGILATRDAQMAHRKVQLTHGEEREKNYDALTGHAERLLRFLDALTTTESTWAEDIRRQKQRDRLPIIIAVITIAVTILVAVLL